MMPRKQRKLGRAMAMDPEAQAWALVSVAEHPENEPEPEPEDQGDFPSDPDVAARISAMTAAFGKTAEEYEASMRVAAETIAKAASSIQAGSIWAFKAPEDSRRAQHSHTSHLHYSGAVGEYQRLESSPHYTARALDDMPGLDDAPAISRLRNWLLRRR